MKMGSTDEAGAEFLIILAHEIRNPLATILSTLELVKAQGTNAAGTLKLLEVVEGRARAISALLDDLLDESRISRHVSRSKKELPSLKKIPPMDKMARAFENPLKVLVVDDNETAADSLGQLLALRGCEIEIAYNGAQALQKALTFAPQVAILDIGMPDMDGYELVGLLRERKLQCTYIALTGYGQDNDKKKALHAGFAYHLTKPAGIKEIETILRKVVHAIKNKKV